MKKLIALGAAVGVGIALTSAGMAMAAPTTYVSDTNFDFGPNSEGSVATDGDFYLGDDSASTAWVTAHPTVDSRVTGSWDGRGYLSLDGGTNYYQAPSDCTQDSNGSDITIVCPDASLDGLTVHPEVYYYSDYDISRVIWVFKNTGASPITANAQIGADSECDGYGTVNASNGDSGTADVGSLVTTNWNWMVQFVPTDAGECAVEGTVWQSEGGAVKASVNDMDHDFGYQTTTFPLNVAAGETVALAVFYVDGWVDDGNQAADPTDPTNTWTINDAATVAAMKSTITTELSDWSTVASRGVAADLNVVNFGATPALPDTGASAMVLVATGTIAAALLVAGTLALVMVRRRLARK